MVSLKVTQNPLYSVDVPDLFRVRRDRQRRLIPGVGRVQLC